jgi:hypothetical protein
LADPDLTETVLPPQLKGNLMARNARDLIEHARSSIENRTTVGAATHQMQFFASSSDFGGDGEWLKLLNNTGESFDIMGVALLSWRQTQGFREVVLQKATHGCKVRILLMHQDNPVLPLQAADIEMLRVNIPQNFAFYQSLAKQNENIEVRQLRVGLMYFLMTRTDQYAVMLQFLSSEEWGKGPLWKCARESVLYQIALKEFDSLWIRAGG